MARSERFELPTLGIEIRCSIQLSYERIRAVRIADLPANFQPPGDLERDRKRPLIMSAAVAQALRKQPNHQQPQHEQG